MPSSAPLLRLDALTVAGLEPVDLDVAGGDCVAIRGSSGSGKSLLLRAVADLDPAGGAAMLDGVPRHAMSGPEWRRRVTYVASDSGWWSERVGDHFDPWSAVSADASRLGLPTDCDHWRVDRLSTGERQRLAVLRALAQRPRVLLLDEPTSGLDEALTLSAERLVRDRLADGAAALWVTHDAAQARRVATRSLAIADGRLAEAP